MLAKNKVVLLMDKTAKRVKILVLERPTHLIKEMEITNLAASKEYSWDMLNNSWNIFWLCAENVMECYSSYNINFLSLTGVDAIVTLDVSSGGCEGANNAQLRRCFFSCVIFCTFYFLVYST